MKSTKKFLFTAIAFSFVLTFVIMFIYEFIKDQLFDDITIWHSHIITIIFTSTLSMVITFFISKRFIYFSSRLKEENRKLNESNVLINNLVSEKELILREVHHRLKNNMNSVFSILSLQAADVNNPEAADILGNAARRVRSMAVLYDKLYCSKMITNVSVSEYLPDLVGEIVSNLSCATSVKTELHVEDFELDGQRLQYLGIIINELLTNIVKYSFIGKREWADRGQCFSEGRRSYN